MKYAMLIYVDPSSFAGVTEEQANATTAEYMEVRQSAGVYGGDRLAETGNATTVRVADGKTLTTDGPFADTKEFLGGYYLFEADNLDAAIALAARIPAARMGGAVEVRPIMELYS